MASVPAITVGMPTFNRGSYLAEAIRHVLAQSYRDFELLIYDDGSTDNTQEVVRAIGDERLISFRSPTNVGIPAVLNAILGVARGEAIVMLHDHDIAQPWLLEAMMEVLDSNPTVGFVNPGVAWIDQDGRGYTEMGGLSQTVTPGSEFVRLLLADPDYSCPVTACALVRRSAYEKVGFRYDAKFGFLSDVDLWHRLGMVCDVGQTEGVGLICRRRGAGHTFSTQQGRLLEWAIAIRDANLRRFFEADPESLRRAIAQHERLARVARRRNVAVAAASGDVQSFMEGLARISGCDRGIAKLVGEGLLQSPTAARAIVGMAATVNGLRRRLLMGAR